MNYPLKLVLLGGLFLSSCDDQLDFFDGEIQDFDITDVSGEFQGPVGYYTFTTNDLIDELTGEDAEVRIDRYPDGGIAIAFNESFSFADFSFAAPVEDIQIQKTVESPLASQNAIFGTSDQVEVTNQNIAVISQFNVPQTLTISENLNFQGNNISKLDFKNTNLNVVVASNANTTAKLEIDIPSLLSKANSAPLGFSLNIPRQGSVSEVFALENFEADFTYNGANYDQTFNNFVIETITTLNIEVGDVLSKNDNFDISFELVDVDSNVVYGVFASEQQNISLPEIELDFFEDIAIDELSISNASIDMAISNSLGVAFDLEIGNSVFSNANGVSQNLILNDSPKRIQQATYSSTNNIVTTAETSVSLNKETSNLPELLELLPTNLNINIDVASLEAPSFFAYDQSKLEGDVDVLLPLDFKIKGLVFDDTIDLEVDLEEEDTEQFESAELHLNMRSNFPLDVSAQLQFLDASGNLLENVKFYDKDDVVFENNRVDLIKGNNDFDTATGKTIGFKDHYLVLKIKKESIDAILDINALQLKVDVDTVGDTEVKFFDDYELKLQVGTSVNLKTN